MYSRFNDERPARTRGVPSYRQVRVPPGYRGLAVVEGDDNLPGNGDFDRGGAPDPRVEGLERLVLPRESQIEPDRPATVEDRPPPDLPDSPALPAPLADVVNPAHFPFGHGIGGEEWLLIGLILLLLREAGSERGDLDETIILLGLLLLGG